MVKALIKTNNLFILPILVCNMRLKSFAHIFVLIFSHTVGDGIVSDVTNILAVLRDFLDKEMFTGVIDWVMAGNLIRKTLTLDRFKLECLDLLVD